jgi:regulator of replication initiation timing
MSNSKVLDQLVEAGNVLGTLATELKELMQSRDAAVADKAALQVAHEDLKVQKAAVDQALAEQAAQSAEVLKAVTGINDNLKALVSALHPSTAK